jgi:2,3-bisphosphoglycerate-independent phosphoglycerate mutase
LKTYGENVGLFKGQQGNSEAGHLNIGAGRIVKQDLVIISDAIKDGTFFKNQAFKQAIYHAKKYKTAVHIFGLLTNGNSAHANPQHLYATLELLRRERQEKVFLHLITDGRDSSPHGATTFLKDLKNFLQPHEKIATIMGRFYAMDRNKIWERTAKAYNAMVLGEGILEKDAATALETAYNKNETDEYVEPTVIVDEKGKPITTINNDDVIIFFNARSDRARQITKAFVQPDFSERNNNCAFNIIC